MIQFWLKEFSFFFLIFASARPIYLYFHWLVQLFGTRKNGSSSYNQSKMQLQFDFCHFRISNDFFPCRRSASAAVCWQTPDFSNVIGSKLNVIFVIHFFRFDYQNLHKLKSNQIKLNSIENFDLRKLFQAVKYISKSFQIWRNKKNKNKSTKFKLNEKTFNKL